jgi:hypothetical protein
VDSGIAPEPHALIVYAHRVAMRHLDPPRQRARRAIPLLII